MRLRFAPPRYDLQLPSEDGCDVERRVAETRAKHQQQPPPPPRGAELETAEERRKPVIVVVAPPHVAITDDLLPLEAGRDDVARKDLVS